MRTTTEINEEIRKLIAEHPDAFQRYAELCAEFLEVSKSERALLLCSWREDDLIKLQITKH
jgi:hypothetical protein